MRYVGYDRFRTSRGLLLARRKIAIGALTPILMFVSIGLLVLSRLDHGYIDHVRWRAAELMRPLLSAILVPLEPFRNLARTASQYAGLAAEAERLRNENQALKGWEWRARELERRLGELEAASNTARDSALPFITARVISNSSSAFVRSVLINAGREQDVKIGYPVLGADGFVGRIVDTGFSTARVMLLTDAQSRIPVLVGRKPVHAVLAGNNGPRPRLIFYPSSPEIALGDDVSTSGVGGLFPRGLRIGTIATIGDVIEVHLHADPDTIEYVSLLFYVSPELEILGSIPQSSRSAARGRPSADAP